MEIESIVPRDSGVNSPELRLIETPNRRRVDRASVDSDKRCDDDCILFGEVESIVGEVEEARLGPCADGCLLSRVELREAQQAQREELTQASIELIGDDQHGACLAGDEKREFGVRAATGGRDQLPGLGDVNGRLA